MRSSCSTERIQTKINTINKVGYLDNGEERFNKTTHTNRLAEKNGGSGGGGVCSALVFFAPHIFFL